ncbi:MAG: HEPN domain-containing protein [Nitrospinae bacterium]|nr:HEPN domain-containing protein [Nitrospinota bacterium]
MQNRERLLKVAREWISKAENDLINAAHTLKLGSKCPTDTVCFHAQQCVEKYRKAVLTMNGVEFPGIHSIANLLALLPKSINLPISDEEQDVLTEYATITRYPGDYEPITLNEARKAVTIARRVRNAARKMFPKGILRSAHRHA